MAHPVVDKLFSNMEPWTFLSEAYYNANVRIIGHYPVYNLPAPYNKVHMVWDCADVLIASR